MSLKVVERVRKFHKALRFEICAHYKKTEEPQITPETAVMEKDADALPDNRLFKSFGAGGDEKAEGSRII